MTRTLTFGPCSDGPECQRFALLVTMFVNGGNLLHFNPATGQPGTRSREDSKTEARFVRAFKAISEEIPKTSGARRLRATGGDLVLEQATFVLMEKYLHAAPRGTQDADLVEDLLDWVSAAPKTE